MADVKWIRVNTGVATAQEVVRADQVLAVAVHSTTHVVFTTKIGPYVWSTDGTANSFGKLMKTLGIDGLG